MATLLYQCPAGISGDMNLAALVALGVDPRELETELRKLPYTGWTLQFEPSQRHGISGLNCKVTLTETAHQHDSDHAHDSEHTHHHRTFGEIREAIESSELAAAVKNDAIACFAVLAEAEGTVHGIRPEAVHFHEVGAIDSIIDIVGAAIGWHLLGVDRIVCASLEVGGGTVRCAHGVMPVPAPATAQLLNGIPYSAGATDKETTTPTGAALLVGKECEFAAALNGTQLKSAIAIGERDDPNLPNVLYVSLLDEAATNSMPVHQETVWEMATNIDDMSAEALSYLAQQLLDNGALDVWQTPATFKKGRLGCVLHALVPTDLRAKLEACFFKHSRTLGVRYRPWQRSALPRTSESLETPWGTVGLKTAQLPDGSTRHKFEHDDCTRIAKEEAQSLHWVETQLEARIRQLDK